VLGTDELVAEGTGISGAVGGVLMILLSASGGPDEGVDDKG
jgi:hypothetical protein